MHPLRLLGAALAASVLLGASVPSPSLYGFSAQESAREWGDEARFLDIPSAQGALDAAVALAARPHRAGTPGDRELAAWSRDLLERYGWEARLEPFSATVETPRTLALELYPTGEKYVPRNGAHRARGTPPLGLDLREQGDAADPPTLDPAVGLPFVAGSADGDVLAPLVYANRGLAEDYETLTRAGVDLRGTIVLVRYGGAPPATLAHAAQDAGASGAIFFSDPADDGAGRGTTYPAGPWRPARSVRRASVGAGIRIPVLAISAENARLLLRSLRGGAGPVGWRGALDAPYAVGKGPAFAHLVVRLARTRTTLWNTIAVLRGSQPAQSVVLGAARDAWVYGVGADGAGTTTLLEAARGLGALAQGGWRPTRSIVVALWDGEEHDRLGSLAYARAHERELRDGCVAYLDAGDDVTGTTMRARSAAPLRPAIAEATRAVGDPARQVDTLYARWRAQPGGVAIDPPAGEPAFVQFGTPVGALAFAGPFGPADSSYDTLRYARTWSDPQFILHRTSAQLYGIVAMRLAAPSSLPYAFATYVPALRSASLRLAARAERDGTPLDLATLRRTIDRFADTARRTDAATARGAGPSVVNALHAAQTLERALDETSVGSDALAAAVERAAAELR